MLLAPWFFVWTTGREGDTLGCFDTEEEKEEKKAERGMLFLEFV